MNRPDLTGPAAAAAAARVPVDRRLRARPRPTRGITAPNRLRSTDRWLLLDPPAALVAGAGPLVVDVGYGADATTAVETHARLRARWPGLRVVGVESDPSRVAAALASAVPGELEFRRGGFDLPLAPDERPVAIRAMNVLRQYDPAEHAPALALMASFLAPGGVLVEGTSSPTGRVMAFHDVRRGRDGSWRRRLVLSVDLRRRWAPGDVRAVLPRDLVQRCPPGSVLDRFFTAWERALVRESGRSGAFTAAARTLAAQGWPVLSRRAQLRRGFLVLSHPLRIDLDA